MQKTIDFRTIKNLLFQIGEDTYERHVSSLSWAPTTPTATWQGGTPDASFTDVGNATWAATVVGAQDFETEDSLANFLLEHAGEQVAVTYKPDVTGTFAITCQLTLAPPAIGGAVGAFPEFTVVMGSTAPEATRIPAPVPETP